MLELLKGYDVRNRFQFYPSVISYKKTNGDNKSENIISAIIADNGYSKDKTAEKGADFPSVGALIINLDADAIQGSIASAPQGQKSEAIIIDKKGQVIFDSLMKNFSGNIGNKDYIKAILTSGKEEDAITRNNNGEKSLVIYKKTDDAHEWTYINVYTYKDLLRHFLRKVSA